MKFIAFLFYRFIFEIAALKHKCRVFSRHKQSNANFTLEFPDAPFEMPEEMNLQLYQKLDAMGISYVDDPHNYDDVTSDPELLKELGWEYMLHNDTLEINLTNLEEPGLSIYDLQDYSKEIDFRFEETRGRHKFDIGGMVKKAAGAAAGIAKKVLGGAAKVVGGLVKGAIGAAKGLLGGLMGKAKGAIGGLINKGLNNAFDLLMAKMRDAVSQGPPGMIPFKSSWASSTFTGGLGFGPIRQVYTSFMATHGLPGYWSSAGGHPEAQIVIWQGELKRIARIYRVVIKWAIAPGEYSILVSDDGREWKEKMPWRTLIDPTKSADDFLSKIPFMPAAMKKDRSFVEVDAFEEPVSTRFLRIMMRGPVHRYFAIYRVEAYTEPMKAMLKVKSDGNGPDECLILQAGLYQPGVRIMAANCMVSLFEGDGREIFVLNIDQQIHTFLRGLCIELQNGVTEDWARIQVWPCGETAKQKDSREKWIVEDTGEIRSAKNPGKCLYVTDKEMTLQNNPGYHSCASSTILDGMHFPQQAIEDSLDLYWASVPGVEEVVYKVTFYPYTITEIEFTWQYLPTDFDVYGLLDGYWKRIYAGRDNTEMKTLVNGRNFLYSGLKVYFKSSDPIKGVFNGKTIYGITYIFTKTNVKFVKIKDCVQTKGLPAKFQLVEVNNPDVSFRSMFNYDSSKLDKAINSIMIKVAYLAPWMAVVGKMADLAKQLRARMDEIDKSITTATNKMMDFRETYLKKSKGGEGGGGRIKGGGGSNSGGNGKKKFMDGSSPDKPSSSCAAIFKLAYYKKSGFYWIQSNCNKEPIRVFCDFGAGKGFPIAYLGQSKMGGNPLKSFVRSLFDVKLVCANIGMHPLEVRDIKHIDTVKAYLHDIGVNFGGNGFIPMAYDYGCKGPKQKCSKQWRSLNSPVSDDISSAVKFFFATDTIFMKDFNRVNRIEEAAGFGMSGQGGFVTFPMTLPIIGVVCSTNTDDAGEDTSLNLRCDTVVGQNPDFDHITHSGIKGICPPGCGSNKEFKVFGVNIYKADSSVCRAAIHAGVFKDEEGGYVRIGLEGKRLEFQGGENNGIISEDSKSGSDVTFTVAPIQIVCPFDLLTKGSFLETHSDISLTSQTSLHLTEKLTEFIKRNHDSEEKRTFR